MRAAVAIVALASACVAADERRCDDGTVCPTALACAPAGGACVEPNQIAACEGLAAGAACDLAGVGRGQCREQLCVVAGCGDGVLDPGEACDDGNDDDDDACSNRCAAPTCGDQIVQVGEACDDGDGNGDDRPCTTRCLRASCGDQFVQAGVEACDDGNDDDDDACTSACALPTCGDGHVYAAVEACDDGNTTSGDGCRADCGKVEACGDAEVDVGEACDDGNGNRVDGCDACAATAWSADVVVGAGASATATGMGPYGAAFDAAGRLYVADRAGHRVVRIDLDSGALEVLVGVASLYGAAGDGGPATAASLALPRGVALDGLGNLYVADTGNHKIRRVDGATGIITTVAGDGVAGGSGDGGPATAARLDAPAAVLVDGLGAVLVADTGNHRIRRIDGTTGIITTVAGDGVAGSSGDGGVATSARLRAPTGLARAPAGDVYIADTGNHRVRRVDAFSGTITNVAGTGAAGGSGDGGPALAATLADPSGLAFEPDGGAGRLHIADAANHRIRVVDLAGGDIVTEAGSGMVDFTGDGGGPLAASFRYPVGVAVAAGGDLCVVDTFNQRIRCVRDGVISTAGGNGRERATGDGGAALSASLQEPRFIAEGPDGALYIAEHGGHQVRRVDPTMRAISVVAGTGSPGDGGDGGPATAARLSSPRGLVIDGDGALLIADVGNHRVRRVDPVTGTISTYAGTGEFGFTGDGVDAASTRLAAPGGLARAPDGDLLIADSLNYRVRRVDAVTHLITTVAGDGTPGAGGDGGPATSAQLSFFHDVAMNPAGELFIADTSNHRVRRVVLDGTISTVAGTGAPGAGGDGGAGVAAQLSSPHGLAVDVDGALLIADTFNQRIRRLVVGGAITTYAGSTYGFGGDGEAPALATFRNPFGVRVMTDGRVLIADTDGPLIREIDAARSRVVTVAGPVDPPGPGPIEAATFVDPHAVVVTTGAVFVAGGDSERVQRLRDDTQLVEAVAGGYPAYPPHPTLARFQFGLGHVGGLAYDATAGVLYVAATDQHTIRAFTVVDPDDVTTWTSAVIAGASFSPGFADGAAASARLRSPTGLYLDEAAGALLIADTGNHVIRSLDLAAGTVATIAGTPSTLGFFGDGGAATDALLYGPRAVTRCPGSGDLYVADTDNHRLRRVQAGSGVITTVLGDGVAASSGQGAPAADFPIDAPMGVACDAAGNVLATSRTAVRLLPAAIALGQAAGEVDGNGPVQTIYGAAPRQGFPERITSCLTGVALAGDATSAGHALVADRCVGYLVELRLDAAS